MSTSTAGSLRLERVVAATPERVFRAWTTPDEMKAWSCPEGYRLERVVSEPRPGGAFELAMVGPEGESHTAHGRYRVVEPPRRLVYTWDWREEGQRMGETVVTVEFVDAPEGGTRVRVTHEGFPAAEARDGHVEGWTGCLDKLVARLA